MLPILLLSLAMGAAVSLIVRYLPTLWIKLLVGIPAGIIMYFAGAILFKFPEFKELMNIIKRK